MDNIEIFPWTENLKTGLPEIDEQHRRLVELLNLLASHVAYRADLPTLTSIFDQLAQYAVYHFSSEEAVWHESFPGDAWETAHTLMHQYFVAEVQRLRSEEGSNATEEVVEDVLSFLCHWLVFHILDSDKRMARAVLAVRAGYGVDEAKLQAERGMSGAVKVLVETVLSMYQTLSSRTLQLMKEISARQKVEAKLRLAAKVFDNTLESICIVDAAGLIVEANPAFCKASQRSYEQVVGQALAVLKTGLGDALVSASIWQSVKQAGHWSGELWSRAASGEPYVEWLTLSAVRNEQGELENYVAVFSNVGQLLQRQRTMEHMANHDALTGLPNRLLLNDRLEVAVANAERLGEWLAVCFLDLDGFKRINDLFGHAIGDEVLRAVSLRLKGLLRRNDTVARLGGDEFVILIGALHGPEECWPFLDRVLATIKQPIEVAEGVVEASASIGVSLFPNDGSHPDELLQRADEAMYQAKGAGKSCYQLYQIVN
jgi:diguanylate cyclase (GGDEF)-like protein/hemerythrin-like metal-binding protein/PAS domain S-box-containing protein